MAGLIVEHVTHAYGKQFVLQDVTLSVGPGELLCLLGPSGCGKTTLLRLAAGLEALQRGQISLGGRVVAGAGIHLPPEQRRVGMVFQDYALFPHLCVRDNVAFGLGRLPAAERRARARVLLERAGMARYEASYPHMLSGGQQQRVALARALAPSPDTLLLDEPFSGLDVGLRSRLRDETLHLLKGSGVAVVMVTHDAEEAMFMADRIAVMDQGRLVQLGAPVELYFRPNSAFVAGFFGDVNRFVGRNEAGLVPTPLGAVPAPACPEGCAVEVLVRPEALLLGAVDGSEGARARVMAVRMLGRTSLIHLALEGAPPEVHAHARIPGHFQAAEGDVLGVRLDPRQTFVFPTEM